MDDELGCTWELMDFISAQNALILGLGMICGGGGERNVFENRILIISRDAGPCRYALGIGNQPREMPNRFHVEEIFVGEPRVHPVKGQSCTLRVERIVCTFRIVVILDILERASQSLNFLHNEGALCSRLMVCVNGEID